MNRPDNDLLDERQDCQEQEENERPVQRWNDEWKMFESLSHVKNTSHQHELCADGGLDDCQAHMSVSDIVRLQNRSFEIDHCREANVEIGRKDDELPQFFACFLAKRRFGFYLAFRNCIRLIVFGHREPPLALKQATLSDSHFFRYPAV